MVGGPDDAEEERGRIWRGLCDPVNPLEVPGGEDRNAGPDQIAKESRGEQREVERLPLPEDPEEAEAQRREERTVCRRFKTGADGKSEKEQHDGEEKSPRGRQIPPTEQGPFTEEKIPEQKSVGVEPQITDRAVEPERSTQLREEKPQRQIDHAEQQGRLRLLRHHADAGVAAEQIYGPHPHQRIADRKDDPGGKRHKLTDSPAEGSPAPQLLMGPDGVKEIANALDPLLRPIDLRKDDVVAVDRSQLRQ